MRIDFTKIIKRVSQKYDKIDLCRGIDYKVILVNLLTKVHVSVPSHPFFSLFREEELWRGQETSFVDIIRKLRKKCIQANDDESEKMYTVLYFVIQMINGEETEEGKQILDEIYDFIIKENDGNILLRESAVEEIKNEVDFESLDAKSDRDHALVVAVLRQIRVSDQELGRDIIGFLYSLAPSR